MSADRELIERTRINVRKELIPIPGGDGPASYRSVTLSPYDMDRLIALASAGADANEATDEFNAGFECAKAGGKITDEPNHCPQDEWRNGFLCGDYERHAAAARLAGVRAGLLIAADFCDTVDKGVSQPHMVEQGYKPLGIGGDIRDDIDKFIEEDAAAVAARGRG